MNTRCKYKCTSVKKTQNSTYQNSEGKRPIHLFTAEFFAVTDGSEENKKFFAWTPTGKLEIGMYTEDLFEPGKEYYLDITEAPVAAG